MSARAGACFAPCFQKRFVYYEAQDGIEAWDILEKQYITSSFSDIMMPNMDGYELSVRSRKNGSTARAHDHGQGYF
jgi:CheY-like chemotaxis protein